MKLIKPIGIVLLMIGTTVQAQETSALQDIPSKGVLKVGTTGD